MSLTILSFFSDFSLILKIFFILAIITFIRRKITHNTLALIVITLAIILLVFYYWPVFGTAYVFYILLTIGASTVLVDVFFVTMGGSGKEAMKAKDSVQVGAEQMMRHKHLKKVMKR